MSSPRSFQIALAVGAFARAWLRRNRKAPQRLPVHLHDVLEGLGTSFIKLGRCLSMRGDVLSPGHREDPRSLKRNVPPYDPQLRGARIESTVGQSLAVLLAVFEHAPFAAASVARDHRSRMRDGMEVAIKVRHPQSTKKIAQYLRLVCLLIRVMHWLLPNLRRKRPLEMQTLSPAECTIRLLVPAWT